MGLYADTVLSLSPAGYWRCGELTGNLVDSSGNGNTATANGTPGYSVAGPSLVELGNTGISTPGTSTDYFAPSGGAGSLNIGNTFTIMAWIKRAGGAGNSTIIARNTAGWNMRLNAGNALTLLSTATGTIMSTATTITDTTTWHFVCASKNGASGANLYIDGVDVSGAFTDFTCTAASQTINIGRSPQSTSENYNGSIDEVAVFSTVISAANILNLYNIGISSGAEGRRRRASVRNR